ncbi:unnamed protein product [Trifolium pratense]|uniref:Uncharacterized protein n=1 Tax=Trifolium pratense TaxID=57577 RepID=A0ACB0IU46_TRIPR|nr:unnamed protein product [Trifolium pratense]
MCLCLRNRVLGEHFCLGCMRTRMHIVICEEHGWAYVGIYDEFNCRDATNYLVNNIFYAVHDSLKGFYVIEIEIVVTKQKVKRVFVT